MLAPYVAKKEESRLTPAGKAAALALTDLQKAIRFYRLYPRDHPFCTRSTEEARDRLDAYFEKHGPLEVEVQREGIVLDEVVVLAGTEQSTDLSNLLYPEGVRELSLEPGLPLEELVDFAVILAAHYPEGTAGEEEAARFTEDLLTALWKRDFGHIEYRVHDELSLSSLRSVQDPNLGALARRIDDLFQGLKREELPEEGLDVEAFLRELDQQQAAGALDDMANWASDPERVEQFLETDQGEERRNLLAELHDPFMGDTLARGSDIVVWASLQSDQPPDRADVARFLVGSTLAALQKGELEQANEILDKVAATDEDRKVLLPAITARLGVGSSLAVLARALENRRPAVDADRIVTTGLEFLSRLDDAAIQGACDVYPDLGQEDVRRAFRRYLSARVERGTDAITKLTTHADQKIVREAVGILALGAEGTAARRVLEEVVRSKEDSPRASVAREVLETVTGERQRRMLLDAARRDPDKRRRLLAVKRLKDEQQTLAFDDLCDIVLAPEFAGREDDEIHVFLDALTALGGLRAVRVLQDLAARKTRLFGRKDVARLKSLAEAWLRSLRGKRPGEGPRP